MPLHGVFLREALLTARAGEGPLARVAPHVALQVGAALKHAAAQLAHPGVNRRGHTATSSPRGTRDAGHGGHSGRGGGPGQAEPGRRRALEAEGDMGVTYVRQGYRLRAIYGTRRFT